MYLSAISLDLKRAAPYAKSMPTRNPAAFMNILPPVGKLVALDVGHKRIGVATSTTTRTLATAAAALPRTPWVALEPALRSACIGAVGLIIGLPLNMDGTAGPMAQSATDFATEAEKRLGLPVLLLDERLTTRQAQGAFFEQREAGTRQTRASTKASTGRLDSAAAVLLLNAALNVLHPA
jgi:putative holliday junction resolvase